MTADGGRALMNSVGPLSSSCVYCVVTVTVVRSFSRVLNYGSAALTFPPLGVGFLFPL